ncbi:MAG: sensor hybrid histidine kinase, partial [Bacteroidetes bacterium]|nr:sensor hybrid histidine kinase [Bacteroidota bacterium]
MATSKKLKAGNVTNGAHALEAPVAKKVKGKKLIGTSEKALNGNGNGHAKNGSHAKEITFKKVHSETLDASELLGILVEIRKGNFNVQMPIDKVGVSGKVCDTLNEIISINKKLVKEFSNARNTIGREGKLNQRIVLDDAQGAWKNGVEDLNALVSDLVYPIREIDRVISAVAKGNLSQQIPIEISNHLLEGEFARIAKEVNDMVKQLNLFTMEVTRVAREVGSEGKLGGQAKVKGVAGVWKDLTDSVNQMAGNLTAQVRNIAD